MTDFAPASSFNRKAMTGFILSLVAILALCSGLLPIPLTALICYPPGFALGVAAFVLGLGALRELRSDGKNGQPFAWFAAWMGGLTVMGIICLAFSGVLLYPRLFDFVQQLLNRSSP